MKPEDLFREGRVREAIDSLAAALRSDPSNHQQRVFLFELLCFEGQYERARKQLDVLASNGKDAMLGALTYQAALNGEITRQEMFERKNFPAASNDVAPISGKLNGNSFGTIGDADPRIGPRLEIFAAGDYLWIAFRDIASLEMEMPHRLRDLLWAPVHLTAGPMYQQQTR